MVRRVVLCIILLRYDNEILGAKKNDKFVLFDGIKYYEKI